MADILANPVVIGFGSFIATSTTLSAATSPIVFLYEGSGDACRRHQLQPEVDNPPTQNLSHRSGNGTSHQHDGGNPSDLRESPALNAGRVALQDLPFRSAVIQRCTHPSCGQVHPDPIWATGVIWRPKDRASHPPRPTQCTVHLP
jgi:hypothetical protein